MMPSAGASALAIAIRRSDWERAALLLLIALAEAARSSPPGTVEDLLALLDTIDAEQPGDGRR
ncbi:MAG: hypothetical protein WEC75_03540 [Dehalococcoidia bacterium]